jgi:hypothetical protein
VATLILRHALAHHRVGRTQDLAGSWGIRSVPLPCSQTPAGPADLTVTVNPVLSPQVRQRRHQRVVISRLNHTASVPTTYASSSTLPYSHARFISGCWLGFTGREFNPLDSDERFLSNGWVSPFPRLTLSQRTFPLGRSVDRLQIIGVPPTCYPSYGASDYYPGRTDSC